MRLFFADLTWKETFSFGVAATELLVLALAVRFCVRQVRRRLPLLERYLGSRLGAGKEGSLCRCFVALERYALILIGLGALWCVGKIFGLVDLADRIDSVVFRIVVLLSVAHVLTLACRTMSQALAAWGERNLAQSKYHRYWERVTRLFPFGERCFELAVYVSTASACVHVLKVIAPLETLGPRVVLCIGILFGTRVIIELLQVLLNEAFSIYEEDQPANQKGQTLVPLLHSVCQYAFYFGAGVMILTVLEIPTSPILAGAGILGLAGGLGAESLITDVVSGFFILFETQYLVGDYITLGDASGRVEAVSIRCTHIRDGKGKVPVHHPQRPDQERHQLFQGLCECPGGHGCARR